MIYRIESLSIQQNERLFNYTFCFSKLNKKFNISHIFPHKIEKEPVVNESFHAPSRENISLNDENN